MDGGLGWNTGKHNYVGVIQMKIDLSSQASWFLQSICTEGLPCAWAFPPYKEDRNINRRLQKVDGRSSDKLVKGLEL